MALKHYLISAIVGTALCWLAWLLVLVNIDPFLSGAIGLLSFYLALFLALLGSFSLLGLLVRRTFSRDRIAYRHINVSLRQGFLLSLVLVGALLLRGSGIYAWWSLALLVAGFTLLEFFFLTREAAS